jgi:hypothetical protein
VSALREGFDSWMKKGSAILRASLARYELTDA